VQVFCKSECNTSSPQPPTALRETPLAILWAFMLELSVGSPLEGNIEAGYCLRI